MVLSEQYKLFQFTRQIGMLEKSFFAIVVAWIPECISYLSLHKKKCNGLKQELFNCL